MAKSFILFDSDSLKDFHKRIFFSMLLFLFVYFVAIYRITQIMIIAPVDKIVQVNETLKENPLVKDVIEFITKDKKRSICTPFLKE